MTLGGLLKHLAWVEELYFQHRLAGRPFMAPFDQLDLERDWDDWAWTTAADDLPDALRALWVKTVHRSRDALAEALARGGLEQTGPDGMSLRRLLADMIEEYARYTGHADLLREQVDGATGEGPPKDFPVPEPGRFDVRVRRHAPTGGAARMHIRAVAATPPAVSPLCVMMRRPGRR